MVIKMNGKENKRIKNVLNEVVQWGIETGASDKEIAEKFGYKNVKNWQISKSNYKKREPELIIQLKKAQRAQKKPRQEIIKNLEEENSRLKARIVLLEQELQTYRQGLNATKEAILEQGIAPKQVGKQTQNENELDRLLRIFDTGRISEEDVAVLKYYQKRLETKRLEREKAHKAGKALIYSNMISAIGKMLSTRQSRYQATIIPELKKFISPQNYGPLYDMKENTTLGEITKRMNMLIEPKVSGLEVAMVINQLQAEGKTNQISDKINLEAISNMRSRLEYWYEEIGREIIPQEKERDD